LGSELASFIREKKLTLLVHYARHDLKHIVLGYETTEQGEVCLQSFMLGNGRVSFPVLATVGYGIFTMPEYWKAMKAAYRKGRQSTPIHGWDWFNLLSEPVAGLQQKIYAS
jgi:ubiquinone biosynthesis protein Coq4